MEIWGKLYQWCQMFRGQRGLAGKKTFGFGTYQGADLVGQQSECRLQ